MIYPIGLLQGLAQTFMITDVTIRRVEPPAQDPTNRTGDNIIEYEPTTTTVKGWFVDQGTKSFDQTGAMTAIVDRPTVRVPVGTAIGSRDEVTIAGQTYTVVDASHDESWPVMIKCGLARIE